MKDNPKNIERDLVKVCVNSQGVFALEQRIPNHLTVTIERYCPFKAKCKYQRKADSRKYCRYERGR